MIKGDAWSMELVVREMYNILSNSTSCAKPKSGKLFSHLVNYETHFRMGGDWEEKEGTRDNSWKA